MLDSSLKLSHDISNIFKSIKSLHIYSYHTHLIYKPHFGNHMCVKTILTCSDPCDHVMVKRISYSLSAY